MAVYSVNNCNERGNKICKVIKAPKNETRRIKWYFAFQVCQEPYGSYT